MVASQGDKVKEPEVWRGFRDLFPTLEEELGLEYGRILLASGSPAELQAILARDWPYLDSFADEVDTCLGGDCTRVATIVQELGIPHFLGLLLIHQICRNNPCRISLLSPPHLTKWRTLAFSPYPTLQSSSSPSCLKEAKWGF